MNKVSYEHFMNFIQRLSPFFRTVDFHTCVLSFSLSGMKEAHFCSSYYNLHPLTVCVSAVCDYVRLSWRRQNTADRACPCTTSAHVGHPPFYLHHRCKCHNLYFFEYRLCVFFCELNRTDHGLLYLKINCVCIY